VTMTRRLCLVLLALALGASSAQKKRRSSKDPDLKVLEVTAHRTEKMINLDGRVQNCGEKTLKGVVLLFDFMAPDQQVITTQKGALTEEEFEPGQESSFHLELADHARAVEYRISAVNEGERDLRVENSGPFPIE